MAKLGYINNNS